MVTTLRRTKNEKGIDAETLYLIRSYNHDEPDPPRPNDKINYGKAEMMQIWEVARAATAAPMYFKEFKVFLGKGDDRQKEKAYFTDGGFGVTNNPAQVGFKEIKALSGSEATENVGVIVSVGTARGKDNPGGKSFPQRMKKLASTATDPDVVAEWMDDQKLDHHWRFNDVEGDLHVELDEWKPNRWFTTRPGRDTLTKIENAFYRWANETLNFRAIEACAKELVKQRRRRTVDRSRWQRFATGASQYRCKHRDCKEDRFDSLYYFEEHWRRFHERQRDANEWKDPTFETWTYQKQNGRHATRRR